MKVLGIVTRWLLILCMPVLLLTVSIGAMMNSAWLYEYGFEKYNVAQTTGLADSELEKAATGLVGYFNSSEEYIDLSLVKDGKVFKLFNQREVIHLKDVKGLIWLDYRLFLGTLVYILGYALVSILRRKKFFQIARGLLAGSAFTVMLMLVLGLGALINFDRLFLQFHLLSFTNEFWLLDPSRDYLIMLFPQGFWYDMFLLCGLSAAGLAILIAGAALFYLKKMSRRAV